MATRIAPELEIRLVDSDTESRPDSPPPQGTAQRVAAAAHAEFTPRAIPNCSWDCTRDTIYSAAFTAVSVLTGSLIDDAEGWKKAIAILGTIGTAAVPIGFAIYGITIRCCPLSQRFWFRR